MTGISSASSAYSAVSFSYGYNAANQRTNVALADGAYWVYTYDQLGQVVSGRKFWSDNTPVAGQQFDYSFDDIGNRKTSARDSRQSSYIANALNQYTSRTVPAYVPVIGQANSNAIVSLWADNGSWAQTQRKGNYFAGELAVNNSTGAVWLTITNLAVMNDGTNADIVTNIVGKALVPKTPETFGHDLDGNLTNDGRWSYTWDAENRPTSFARIGGVPSGAKVRLDCSYDAYWRRTQKVVSTWSGESYVAQSTNKFVYDGWNLVAILDGTNGLVQSFTWGTDLSGTAQGAGGVGGLISMTMHQGTNAGTYFYCFDGNGNVTALVSAASGELAAQWEYDPFLNVLRATGPLAYANPFLGSTKFYDWETGFYYYGYRYYDPSTGRWLSRDPIGELGGVNLYGFVGNDVVNAVDPVGHDFIAVGDRYVTYTPGLFRHMSIEFFEEPCPQTQEGESFSTDSVPNSASGPTDSFELQPLLQTYRHFFYTRPKPTEPPVRSFTWDLVSEIRRSSTPRDFVVIYSDVENSDAAAKWKAIVAAATTYAYGEQEANYGTLFNWPNSKYDLFGNNSNTFIREMARVIGRNADVVGGWHPGNLSALPVADPGYVPVFSPWGNR